MSIKIYPSRIKQKTNSMNIQLNSLEEKVETEKTNMDEFLSTTSTLKGRAWDSARSYVREIQQPLLQATDLWIVVQIKANNKYYKAADKLPQVQCLDQSLLERQLRQWEKRLDREYDKENPNENRISRYELMISQINSKLNAIEEFVSKTEGIYNSAVDLQNVLSNAETEINKVSFNPDTQVLNFASVDRQWVHEFERLRDIEKLKADGLTEEQVKEAEELGFTPEEILVMWEEMKEQEISRSDLESMDKRGLNFGTILEAWSGTESEEDKILVTGLIKGNYEEAFLARASEINANTHSFYTEYMLQTSINCTDGELQAIINEILKQHSDGEARNISSYANSMGYINMLYTGTTNALDIESMLFLDSDSLSDERINEYLKRNEKLMALAAMSGAIYEILGDVNKKYNKSGQSVDLSSINIDSLCYIDGINNFTFNIAYQGNLRKYNDNIQGLIDMGQITEVKSVVMKDIEKSKVDRLTVEQLKEALKLGFTPREVLAMWEEMKEQEISRLEIQGMEELGYSVAETFAVWNSLDGKEDKHFFACLIGRKQEKCMEAFGIDPNDLSDNMTQVMAEYASRLLEYGKEEELITLNNALLSSKEIYYDVMLDGTKRISDRTTNEVYLQRMYAGTAVLLEAHTILLAAMEGEIDKKGEIPKGYNELKKKHTLEMDMCSYWASQRILVKKYKEPVPGVSNLIRISELEYNREKGGGSIDYIMNYAIPIRYKVYSNKVNTSIVNSRQLTAHWEKEELKSLEKAKDKLAQNLIVDTIEEGIKVGLTYTVPEAAILMSVLIMSGKAAVLECTNTSMPEGIQDTLF